jgi:hypothetical protein
MHIDFKRLEGEMQNPLWYLYWAPQMKELNALKETAEADYEVLKEEVYDFFEGMLKTGRVALGSEVGLWDDERKAVDTAVIHHTSNALSLSLERLSAIELARIYSSTYASPPKGDEAKMVGKSISSGHVYDLYDKRKPAQVFWSYHYLIREDGFDVPMLSPREVGWHAGNWEMNCRSIGICFDGDYEHSRPNDRMLLSAAKLISRHKIPRTGVKGHCEVRIGRTICPSRLFLSEEGRRGWKEDLLELL